ncbi:serine/threonine-protein kinase [Mycolicibacter heraklionensis]|uniref:serine/threonine-protein kinase n=1 Tax=Mycolicibacter heraklionensis TaxID=512402 RepID=UPI0009EEDDD3|nr:serine/threonine-protein kinase [Mycolicibacter heraklionensis]
MSLTIGETFAEYRILRLLGSGGMGEVYLARHPRLPREDALKVLRPDVSSDTSFRERFIREADLAAGLRHPHIVGVHDRGEHDGQLWIAMDFIDGTDAAQLLAQRYPTGIPIDVVGPIVTAIASALDYAHRKGLLHRDVKPANIIVADFDSDGPNVFLADFGIARPLDDIGGITTTNMTVGTVAYAAPEQLMGEPMGGRADQYALAATTYHLLTGSQLFPNSNPAVVISRHLNAPPPFLADARPELTSLDLVLAAALAKNPDDRFACCTDFARALTETAAPQILHFAGDPTVPAAAARRPQGASEADGGAAEDNSISPSSGTRWLIGISVAAVLLTLGAIATLWQPWQHPRSDTPVTSSNNVATTSTPTPTTTAAAPPSVPPEPPPLPSTGAAPPEGYFSDVRRAFTDWNHGQGMGDTSGTHRVLTEVFNWVCQHQDTEPNVVNQQIQMQETWFNHPSIELYEANRLRSIAMSYCPTSSITEPLTTAMTAPAVIPPATTAAPSSDPESCVEGSTRYSEASGITYTCRNGSWHEGPPGYPN